MSFGAPLYSLTPAQQCRSKNGTWNGVDCISTRDGSKISMNGGKHNLIGPLKKGTLMGYSARMKPAARHKTLRKVIRKVGPLSTFRKLNAIAVLTKRTAPKSSRKMQTDRKWVKKNFM